MAFTAKFTLDLNSASTRAFGTLLDDFEAWRATEEPRELDLTNGWKTVTQEIAEAMLLRNPIGANRRPTLPTVKYYARQMVNNEWKKTGQPIIFTTDGVLKDAGHRLWACYLSGASFPTYLVGDVPNDPTLFAYIDNSKARSASDALATAGLDGLAKRISSVINIAMHYDHRLYTTSTEKKTLQKTTPIEVVHYATEHENLRLGARLMAGEYQSAASVIGHKDVASFTAYQILELHGEDTLENFMTELGDVTSEPLEGSPVAALQKVLKDDMNAKDAMKKHQVLGYIIKAFNAWYEEEPVKKLSLRVNETFPQFVSPQPIQQAAE
jgi:hypothetical protein